jgi:hypothetical protein
MAGNKFERTVTGCRRGTVGRGQWTVGRGQFTVDRGQGRSETGPSFLFTSYQFFLKCREQENPFLYFFCASVPSVAKLDCAAVVKQLPLK